MKKKELIATRSATPDSRGRPKKFTGKNIFDVAVNILENHIRESKGYFISQDDIAISGPIKERHVIDALITLSRDKDSKTKKLFEDVAALSCYEQARKTVREILTHF
ncbi:hypothetical protein JXA56_04540 [Candidatus Micrarchaeota archaeon]|nr:hypothetical protein [Candidatus Micrarchaeota archaeon]